MSSAGAAPCAAVSVSEARAAASRKNGARSRGPKTAEGKARSAQNALKHGLRAERFVVLADEHWDEFAALEAAFIDELAPEGALQRVLAGRVARTAWRLMRADRLEVELFEERAQKERGVGLALIRDGNGTRSFETLLRYRGAAQAELWRALRTLKALQAEPASRAAPAPGAAAVLMLEPQRTRTGAASPRAPTGSAGEVTPPSPSELECGAERLEAGRVRTLHRSERSTGIAGAGTNEPTPAARGPADTPAVQPSALRIPSWAGRGRGGSLAGSETAGARSGRTAPGAPEAGRAAGPQLARSTP